jgi:AbrB family looped-hinge helix DNA binding protein
VSSTQTVSVGRRFQIAVPSSARERLNIKQGDRLLVDVQDGVLILVPKPSSYTDRLTGLHNEIWQDVDAEAYLESERNAWDKSATD